MKWLIKEQLIQFYSIYKIYKKKIIFNFSCIQENSLNSEVLMSSINALDFFCMNKSIRLTVAEKDGTAIVVKILKSQDWNKV